MTGSGDTPMLGVSQPISLSRPSDGEKKLTEKLEATLRSFNLFETDEEMEVRLEVLRSVNSLVKRWVHECSLTKLPAEECSKVGGKLFTFGSYRLGVHGRGADIDSLCVVPRHIDRSDFFSSFYKMLSEDPNVTDLHKVEDAFVPLIKLYYCKIDMDILFARLALKEVPDEQTLDDDMLLKNLDEKCIRSLNGSRVADQILRLVPNVQTYTLTLRSIKLWAQNHGIYSNVLGFLGGISWAILVARVCQLYPNYTPSKLVNRFFMVFATWDWPHPVYLKDIDSSFRPDISSLTDLVWDPRTRSSDRYHLMPIITPAFPEQNSTFNVTTSTRTILMNEFKEGLEISHEIMEERAEWKDLFAEINFFSRYKHFLMVVCAAESVEHQLVWEGMVKSKLRHLTGLLERNPRINIGHINPKTYKPTSVRLLAIPYENPVVDLFFVGLEFNKTMGTRNVVLTDEITGFHDTVNKATRFSKGRETYTEDMKLILTYVPRKDLIKWIPAAELTKGRNAAKIVPPASAAGTPSTPRAVAERRQSTSASVDSTPTTVVVSTTSTAADEAVSSSTSDASTSGDLRPAAAAAPAAAPAAAAAAAAVMDGTCSSSSGSAEAAVSSSTTSPAAAAGAPAAAANNVSPAAPVAAAAAAAAGGGPRLAHSISLPNLDAGATSDRQAAPQLPLASPEEANAANPLLTEAVRNELTAPLPGALAKRKLSAPEADADCGPGPLQTRADPAEADAPMEDAAGEESVSSADAAAALQEEAAKQGLMTLESGGACLLGKRKRSGDADDASVADPAALKARRVEPV